jgi:alanine dehydrogenase
VLVEAGAGEGSSITDEEYAAGGRAHLLPTAAEVWAKADLVIKVKEPQPAEYGFFRPGLVLFTYLHLAPLPELTERLLEDKGQAASRTRRSAKAMGRCRC